MATHSVDRALSNRDPAELMRIHERADFPSTKDDAQKALLALARELGEGVVDPLIDFVRAGEYLAIRALGQSGSPRAIEPLVRLLGESTSTRETRIDAARALAALGATGAAPLIQDLIKESGLTSSQLRDVKRSLDKIGGGLPPGVVVPDAPKGVVYPPAAPPPEKPVIGWERFRFGCPACQFKRKKRRLFRVPFHSQTSAEVVCKRCGVYFDVERVEGDVAPGAGECFSWAGYNVRDRWKHVDFRTRTYDVTIRDCPACQTKRAVYTTWGSSESYTGICKHCGWRKGESEI